MERIRVRKQTIKTRQPHEIDTRTPSGRRLPY